MPICEFRCRACGKKTTAVVLARARVGEVECRHCGGRDLVRLVSRFATPKSDETRLERLADPASLAGIDDTDPQRVAQWMKRMSREMGEDVSDDVDRAIEDEFSGRAGPTSEPGEDT